MPTVLRKGPYRLYFYGHDIREPAHVHVDRDNLSAKFWLEDVNLASNVGFSPSELKKVIKLVGENRESLLEKWHGYFGR